MSADISSITEDDWSNTEAKIHPYQKSKTLAEKAAWEFIQQEGKGLEYSDYVDVRDVAELHNLAMVRPETNGERFIASSAENLSTLEIANILRRKEVPIKNDCNSPESDQGTDEGISYYRINYWTWRKNRLNYFTP
ncbi:hypothetical protein NST07_33880 [Paenibacillus sp. FSL L8-0340]|uniref:hypothetical protein n=1 Tax=Paenibacillus sp. FSL L8-0340 TaxID=2954685 RepID=UPI00315877EB